MSILAKAGSLLSRFRRDQKGQVALTFGLAVIPMLLFSGGAIDFVHTSGAQTRLQYALDSAALAAASSKNISDKQRVTMAQDVFEQNWESEKSTKDLTATAKFKVQGNAVKGEASATVPTAFLRIAGINSFDIGSDVSISLSQEKKAEVALVLDYSGSMTETSGGQVKYVAMKNAAKKLVDDLSKQAPGQVRVGLVPFSRHVYITLPKKYVAGQGNAAGDWTGCTQDRPYPYNISDETPQIDKDETKWGQSWDTVRADRGCAPYAANRLIVRPLTDDFGSINRQLDAMYPYQWTHVALGAEFGWHILAPNSPFSQGAEYNDKNTQKVMVVLSDGRQTVPGFGKGTRRDEASANANFIAICKAADRKGIRVITIAFDMNDEPDAQARMRSCASDPSKDYYEPESGDDVAKAFEDIQTQIAASVFISK